MNRAYAALAATICLLFASGAGADQPVPWQLDLQQAASPIMHEIRWFSHYSLWFIVPITLFVEGFAPIKARTAWSDSGFAELVFDQHLHLSVVQHMARQSTALADSGVAPGVPRAAHAEFATLSQEHKTRI